MAGQGPVFARARPPSRRARRERGRPPARRSRSVVSAWVTGARIARPEGRQRGQWRELAKACPHSTTVKIRATSLSAVPPAPNELGRPRRRARRLAGSAGVALAISVAAHAVAAVTIGTVLSLARGAGDTSPETVAVDVESSPVVPAPHASLPGALPGAAAGGPSVSVWHRRTRASRLPVLPAGPSRGRQDAEPPLSRFVLAAGTVTTAAGGPPTGPAGAFAEDAGGGDVIAGESDVDAPAQLVKTSPLVYPEAARRAGIETDFPVEIVIDTDGRVMSARALRQAGYGLDEAAMGAIRAYRFSPGFRAGRPVRVRMRWTLQFRLR